LGGLLFGYDIGATSGATISLQVNLLFNVFQLHIVSAVTKYKFFNFVDLNSQSPELSGISWFKLSAIQLGLVV